MTKASILVDNGPPVIFAPQQQTANITNNNQYFYTDKLDQGEHTITITALNDNTVWIDYFLVVPGDVTVTPTTTGLPAVSTSQRKTLNAGAIAGGTLGGLSVLAAAILSLLFWIRRKKKQLQIEYHQAAPGKWF